MSSGGGMAIPDAEPPAKERETKEREPKEPRAEKEPNFGESTDRVLLSLQVKGTQQYTEG